MEIVERLTFGLYRRETRFPQSRFPDPTPWVLKSTLLFMSARSPLLTVRERGADLSGNAIRKWQQDRKVDWHCIAAGKPMQNGPVGALQAGFVRHSEEALQVLESPWKSCGKPVPAELDLGNTLRPIICCNRLEPIVWSPSPAPRSFKAGCRPEQKMQPGMI
jgi:transposase InsO family protein